VEEKIPEPVSTTFAERWDLLKRAALLGLNAGADQAEKPADPDATQPTEPA
jgi:hypothetical protein